MTYKVYDKHEYYFINTILEHKKILILILILY